MIFNRGVNLLRGPELHLEIAHPYQSWLPLPGKSAELGNETLSIQLVRIGNGQAGRPPTTSFAKAQKAATLVPG